MMITYDEGARILDLGAGSQVVMTTASAYDDDDFTAADMVRPLSVYVKVLQSHAFARRSVVRAAVLTQSDRLIPAQQSRGNKSRFVEV